MGITDIMGYIKPKFGLGMSSMSVYKKTVIQIGPYSENR